jgi:CXXX repeat peptide maturase
MKYLIIQLCDSAVSFCSYQPSSRQNLIPLSVLKDGLIWGIKNGLNIQILYPEYPLSKSYDDLINEFEHIEIRPLADSKAADIFIAKNIDEIQSYDNISFPVVLHCNISEFLARYTDIAGLLSKVARLNIFFNDIPNFAEDKILPYEQALTSIANKIIELYLIDKPVQFNLITDRTMLSEMNNCNAGVDSITISPDGQLYVCPAFYLSNSKSCGNLRDGVNLLNDQLYKIQYAPICRICDAYHCRRCVMLNQQLTLEINTPGHQQCVMSHIERKVSKKLLDEIRRYGEYASNVSIPEIDYNDPFYKIINRQK